MPAELLFGDLSNEDLVVSCFGTLIEGFHNEALRESWGTYWPLTTSLRETHDQN